MHDPAEQPQIIGAYQYWPGGDRTKHKCVEVSIFPSEWPDGLPDDFRTVLKEIAADA